MEKEYCEGTNMLARARASMSTYQGIPGISLAAKYFKKVVLPFEEGQI